MKIEVQELLMELGGAMKRKKLEEVASYLLNPKSGWKHDHTLQELASLHLRIASLDELAQRLAHATDGQFDDLRLALDDLSKLPPYDHYAYPFYVGERPPPTPEERAAQEVRLQAEKARAAAYTRLRDALQKVGEKVGEK